jgi:hypothetical protein
MTIPPPPWWIIPLLLLLVIAMNFAPQAHGETSNEWLELVVAIERQSCTYKQNREDQAFLGQMKNVLTLDEPPELNWRQRKWLRTLKRECRL